MRISLSQVVDQLLSLVCFVLFFYDSSKVPGELGSIVKSVWVALTSCQKYESGKIRLG